MRSAIATDLSQILGPERVSTDPEDLDRFSADALGRYRAFRAAPLLERARPDVVVRPTSTEEVLRVVDYALREGVPLVPVGGGTGVMGAATPICGGIVLDLKGMGRVVAVDREARTATVEAGAVLAEVEAQLNRHGLMLGHDPWSLPIATVGGAISTNGVGYRAGKYGPMGAQVLGLEVVLPTGDLLQTRAVPLGAGIPLHTLFVGAEGALGVITRATLQVFPLPEERDLQAYSFPDFEAGFAAVMEMFSLNLQPAMVDFSQEREGEGWSAELYLCFEGPREEVQGQAHRARQVCLHHGGQDLGQGEARRFWEQRHLWGERYKREVLLRPPEAKRRREYRWRMDYLHIALPASRVLDYRRQASALLQERGVPVAEWSIWARPDMFSLLVLDPTPADNEAVDMMARTVDDLLSLAHEMGGSMEYCHGVGIKLLHLLEGEWGKGLALLRRIKGALDPARIMNPGKLGL